MSKIFAAVQIIACGRWMDLFALNPWVLKWVDIDGLPPGVFGKLFCSWDKSVIITGGVVGFHGGFIVSIEVIDKTDAADGVFCFEQATEDV